MFCEGHVTYISNILQAKLQIIEKSAAFDIPSYHLISIAATTVFTFAQSIDFNNLTLLHQAVPHNALIININLDKK